MFKVVIIENKNKTYRRQWLRTQLPSELSIVDPSLSGPNSEASKKDPVNEPQVDVSILDCRKLPSVPVVGCGSKPALSSKYVGDCSTVGIFAFDRTVPLR